MSALDCRAIRTAAAALLMLIPVCDAAAQVTIAWNPSPESDVAGYRIYVGAASRTYHDSLDVGNRTVYTVTGLQDDRPYYFAVTAYTSSGVESAFSSEITTATITRLAPEDTSILLNAVNHSAHPALMTYTWPDRRVANAVLLKFDLSSVPPYAVVQNATLHLTLIESDGAPERGYSVGAHKIVGRTPLIGLATGYTADGATPWTPSTCCHRDVPLAQADIAAAEDVTAVDQAAGGKTWTITRMVQDWVTDPETNAGLLINSDAAALADRYRYFASMEHPDAARRPSLHIEYFAPRRIETTPPAALVARLVPQDTSLLLNATNYSAHGVLMTYTWPDRRVANAAVLKFDLSSLPSGAVVHDATLRLALVESDAALVSTYTVTAHKIVGRNPAIDKATGHMADAATGWTATACCHDNVPLAQADISPAYDTRAIDQALGEKTWTLTQMVQEWLADPSSNFGVLLNSDAAAAADRYRYFASAEHAAESLRPVLQITYSVAK